MIVRVRRSLAHLVTLVLLLALHETPRTHALTIYYPDNPLFWYWNGTLNATTAGGGTLLITGDYFLAPGQCTIAPVVLFNFNDGSQASCDVTYQDPQHLACTVPPGSGAPHVTINICGQLNRDLPRMPTDFVFYVGSSTPVLPAWCTRWVNSNAVGWRSGDTPVYMCSSDSRQKLSSTCSSCSDRPLFTYATSNSASKRCIRIIDPLYPSQWTSSWICTELDSPYYFTLNYTCTSTACQTQCLQLLNSQSTSTTWTSGNSYLCTTNFPSPFPSPDTQLLYHYLPPYITAITPLHAPTTGSTTLTFTGTSFGFLNVTTIAVMPGGAACNVTVLNHTYAECIVPPGQGASNYLQMITNGQVSNTFAFTYDPPLLYSVLPQYPDAAGGANITITGLNFGTSGGVVIGASQVSCYPIYVYNNSMISCAVPAGQGANQVVSVQVTGYPSNLNINSGSLTYLPPVVQSVTPSSYETVGSVTITVKGRSFGTSGTVTVGGLPCGLTGTGYSTTQIQCILPVGQGANNTVVVTASSQSSNPSGLFSYLPPNISSITPQGGTGPNLLLTLAGTSFGTGISNAQILISGQVCTPATSGWAHRRVLCYASNSVGLFLPVQMNVSGQLSNIMLYSYSPVITNVSAIGGRAPTAGGVLINVTGNGLANTSMATATVKAGTVDCPVFQQTAAWVTCMLPPGGGTVGFTVSLGAGLTSAPFSFSYDPPSLYSVSPVLGPTAGGQILTLTGVNFGTTPSVTIGGVASNITWNNDTMLIVVAPTGSGANNLVIASAGGGLYTTSVNYGYYPPSINSITPNTGPSAGGFNVTITGGNFSYAISLTFVIVSGVSVSPLFQNDTMLVLSFPPYSNQFGVTPAVLVNGQTSSQALTFLYQGANISSVFPSTGPTQGGVLMKINGTNFGSTGYVMVGAAQAILTGAGYSPTYIECILPAGQGPSPISVIVGTAASVSYPWNYTAPTINSIAPSVSDTSGSILTTITGINFGSSGTVTIGSYICVTNVPGCFYNSTRIICQVPAGQGASLPVTLTASTLSNTVKPTFSYNPPTITALSPTIGPTVGGGVLTVYGSNFGLTAVTTFYSSVSGVGLACVPYGLGQSHTQIQCTIPPYQGAFVPVFANVSNQISNGFGYQFYSPTITGISPLTSPTQGGANITLTGTNFGIGSNYTVTFSIDALGSASSPTVLFYNQTRIIFVTPAGAGLSVAISFNVAGQLAAYSGAAFSYQAPVVTAVSGCTSSDNSTVNCPTVGGSTLTITGRNFYTQDSLLNVTVNGRVCTNPTIVTPHTVISCTLPAAPAGGFNLPVSVNVSGLIGSASLLSYAGPSFTAGSIVETATTSIQAPETSSLGYVQLTQDPYPYPINISLRGNYWFSIANDITITYGPKGGAKPYTCAVYAATLFYDSVTHQSQVTCAIGAGVGANLTFVIKVGLATSVESIDTISYATPVVIGNTIRSSLAGTPGSLMIGTSSQGDSVFFDVAHVGQTASALSVFYGSSNVSVSTAYTKQCTQVQLYHDDPTNAYTVSCLTGSGAGSNYSFQVWAGNARSASGTDRYSYITAPLIYQVKGCTDSGSSTLACPTAGGTRITIIGDYFTVGTLGGLSVTVGTSSCNNVVFINTQTLTCITPAGAGSSVSVIVTTGLVYSPPTYLLGYASATLTGISGCALQFGATTDCPRAGGIPVTVTGKSFGPANATVLIDGQSCSVLSSNDTAVSCTLPAGTQLGRSVILIQNGGSLTIGPSTVYVSYHRCESGTFAPVNTIACTQCVRGTYADTGTYTDAPGLTACKNCGPGTYAGSPGASACTQCAVGSYAAALAAGAVGATSCTLCSAGTNNTQEGSSACGPCKAGTFNSLPGQSNCTQCSPGTYSATSGSTTCLQCPVGQYNTYAGAVGCVECPIGTIAATADGGASSCIDCSAGSVTTQSGQTECTRCTPGYYAPTSRLGACLSCDAGTFSNDTGLTACYQCPTGYYAQKLGASGASACTACAVGTYTDAIGQGECLQCEQGSYADSTGFTACLQCTIGHYASTPGLTTCSKCPAGTFTAVNGTSSCTACPVGSFSTGTGNTECTLCPLGYSQSNTGQTACSQCAAGYYMPSTGQAVCLACDAGTYTDQPGQSECNKCPAGSYCTKSSSSDAGPTRFVSCDAGYYSLNGSESCTQCEPGKYSGSLGASTCYQCPAGQSALSSGATACENCTAGTYSPAPGALHCLNCPIGQFMEQEGATVCQACDPGYYAPSTGSESCFPCAAGSYADLSGQGACLACQAGSYSVGVAPSGCSLCAAGSYQPNSGYTSCVQCAAGYAQGVLGQVSCEACPAGSFSNTLGSATCSSCPVGTASSNAGVTSCTTCIAGTFTSTVGQLACSSCAVGTYSASPKSTACLQCPAGTYASTEATSSCSLCLPGSYAPDTGAIECYKCKPGTRAANNGSNTCDECPPGQYQASSGASTCTACSTGTYAESTGAESCVSCPAGSIPAPYYYNDVPVGSTSCQQCVAGTYQPTAGGSACLACGSGTYTDQPGQASCVSCPAGYMAVNVSSSTCLACGPGTSQSTTGSASCSSCSAGQYSNATSASACLNCAPGSYTNSLGNIQCTQCIAGAYQSLAGQKGCNDCPAGSFSDSKGAAACVVCPPGYYQNVSGSISCQPCWEGSYQSQSNQSTCLPCPTGRFSNTQGASICSACAAGSYQNATGATRCVDCAIGQYQGNNGETTCLLCAPGTIMPYEGKSACTPCPAGYYTSFNGSLNCTACGLGTYAPVQGSSTCQSCGIGTFQDAVGQSGCQNCALGSAEAAFNLTRPCTRCAAGQYAGVPGLTACVSCERGRYGPIPGMSTCALCAAGSFANTTGNTVCSKCAPGLAQPNLGQQICLGCDLGYYSLGGQSACTACEAGYYGTVSNATTCAQCGPGYQQQIPGSTTCQQCPAGTASSSDHIDTCPLCAPGTFQPSLGQQSCSSCGIGLYQDSYGSTDCKDCAPGSYNSGSSARNCTLTSKGFFTNTSRATAQIPCSPGFYQPGVNSSACVPCPVGRFQQAAGKDSCDPCPAGTYAAGPNSTQCTSCDPGYYQPATGQSWCLACKFGYYASVRNKQSCDACPAGYYADFTAATACSACPIGSHQAMTNATACEQCAPGTFANTEHSVLCTNCPAGYHQSTTNSTACIACAAGSSQPDEGQSECNECAPGSFSNSTGLSACNLCDPGYYTMDTGAQSCDACPLGTSQSTPGATACDSCSLGQFSNQLHLAECYNCPAGSFNIDTNATICQSCTAGSAQPNTGQTACLPCDAGFYQDHGNQETCSPCTPGSFASDTGSLECTQCTTGHYQGGSGQASCLPCPLGTYHNGTGATQCEECGYGEFQDNEGGTSCQQCQPGTFKSQTGAGDCLPCWPGEFTTGYGQKICSTCPAGYHSNATLAIQCDQCEIGTASAAVNQSTCQPCKPGYYMPNTGQQECLPCGVGSFSAGNGSSACTRCSVGSYQPFQGQSSCLPCKAGQSTGGEGASYCTDCTAGTFGNTSSTVSLCNPCPAGTYGVATGVTVCKDCAPGSYSEAGQQLCTACADLTVAASAGSTMCVLCDVNSVSNLDHTACLCNPGYYLPITHIEGSSYFACDICPTGADCSGYGNTVYNLRAQSGWWRSNNATLNFYRCPISKYCTGGEAEAATAVNAATGCLNHRAGILCSTCELGYHEQAGGSCVECPQSGVSWISVAFIGLAIAFLVWLQVYIIVRSGRDAITKGLQSEAAADTDQLSNFDDEDDDSSDLSTSSSEYETDSESNNEVSRSGSQSQSKSGSQSQSKSGSKSRSKSSKSGSASRSEPSVSRSGSASVSLSQSRSTSSVASQNDGDVDGESYNTGDESYESEYESSESEDEEPMNPIDRIDPATINFHLRYGPPEKSQDFTYKLKIFLSFLQIATNLGTNLNIVWPTTYVNFLLFFDVANFDFALSSVASADCIGSFSYYNKFVAIVLAPPIILVVVALLYLLPNYLECGPFRKYTLQERQRGKMNFWRLFLYLLFLVYPSVSSTVLRLYVCKQIDDAAYLATDLRVQCYTSDWTLYTYISLALILLYPIGIPIFFFSLLRVNQNHLRAPRIKAQLGFLYGGYRGECWWFEIAENIHKLTLTSVLAFLPESSQLPTGMGICVLYFLILLLINPYLSSFDDLLSLYAECEIFLLVTAGWIFYNNPQSSVDDDLLLSICLIGITVFFFLAFLFAALYVMATLVIKWRIKRRIESTKQLQFEKEQNGNKDTGDANNPNGTMDAFVPPVKKIPREFVFVKEWLEESKEGDDELVKVSGSESESSDGGRHSRGSLSQGEDWSDDGAVGIDSDDNARPVRVRTVRAGPADDHPFTVDEHRGSGVTASGPKSMAAKADAILAAKPSAAPSDSDGSDSDDAVDLFGLNIDDEANGGASPRHAEANARRSRRRHGSDSVQSEEEERDEVDDLADLMAPRVRREGEEDDITKNMVNIISAAER